MKILKLIGFVVLFGCIFFGATRFAHGKVVTTQKTNIQVSDLQTQKKVTILNNLEKENLILTEVKKLGKKERDEVLCLSLNMYHEARGSSIEDRIASSYVVFNRQNEKHKSICGVVFERWQFCWTNGKSVSIPREKAIWEQIQRDALKMYQTPIFKKYASEFRLKHYVATYMIPMKNKPKWVDKRKFKVEVGKHSYISLDNADRPYINQMNQSLKKGRLALKLNISKK